MTFILYIIIIIPHPRTACGSHRVSLLFSLLVSTFLDYFIGFRYFHIVKRMQMQSSHIRTVGLCFLACKAASFWSIFQKNSKKTRFLAIAILVTPYGCTVCSSPYIAFLSVTPYGWLLCSRGSRWMFEIVSE